MKRTSLSIAITLLVGFFLVVGSAIDVFADGTETLGPPLGIMVASGSEIIASGTGLFSQPGIIAVDIPIGATVKQVLLYWECQHIVGGGDNTILVNSNSITGNLIGGPTAFGPSFSTSSYRADITSLGLVGMGSNTLTIEGLNCTGVGSDIRNDGAGVLVIIDDGINTSEIQIRDGNDFAYHNRSTPLDTTVAQTFTFPPDDTNRAGDLIIFAGSVGRNRPNSIEVTVNGDATIYSDMMNSNEGEQWDTLKIPVSITAGASMLTIQLLSRDDLSSGRDPASLVWVNASLSLTGLFEGCTPGYWKQEHHFDSWPSPYSPNDYFESLFAGCNVAGTPTLLDALKARGGGLNALMRHAVAALLNAASANVNYPYDVSSVMSKVVAACQSSQYEETKNELEGANESSCPLD